MSFNPNVPNASQPPDLFPPQNATNFSRLQTIIQKDHQFNETAQVTDGVHKQVTMIARALATPASLPAGTQALTYAWVDTLGRTQLRFYNGSRDIQLTPCEVIAAVNFNGNVIGEDAPQNIRSSFNISSVTRVGTETGKYLVTFANALPNNNYVVQITGKGAGSNGISNGSVDGSLTYLVAVKTTSLRIIFNGSGSSLIDVMMGNVVIMRVS